MAPALLLSEPAALEDAMSLLSRYSALVLGLSGWVAGACQQVGNPVGPTGPRTSTLPAPQHLAYQLDPSGNPAQPAGILLVWDDVVSSQLQSYRVYSRATSAGTFGLRGETSSNTFHDNGVPHLEYYVTAVDVSGGETSGSNSIVVDQRLQLQAPTTVSSIALNAAVQLNWADNAYVANPTRFKWYRVYGASFDRARNLCGTDWALEGTTVAHEFLAAQLPNGVSRCFATAAISVEGYESLWSPLVEDTPRPDARNVLVWAQGVKPAQAGFRFADPVTGQLGLVVDGARSDIDFSVYVQPSDSSLWLVPQFAGDSIVLYSSAPIADLTSIATAPASGYTRNMIQAVPGYGYVFKRGENGVVHYGAVRVTAVSRQYVIFDWSYQTAAGNPELVTVKGSGPTGTVVTP
jgi:hypothetical protein